MDDSQRLINALANVDYSALYDLAKEWGIELPTHYAGADEIDHFRLAVLLAEHVQDNDKQA